MLQPDGKNGKPSDTCRATCDGYRPAEPENVDRNGILFDAVQRNPGQCTSSCLGALRKPRPSCCRKSSGLSVGRSIIRESTAGNVHSLIEQIHGEHNVHSSSGEIVQCLHALHVQACPPTRPSQERLTR